MIEGCIVLLKFKCIMYTITLYINLYHTIRKDLQLKIPIIYQIMLLIIWINMIG